MRIWGYNQFVYSAVRLVDGPNRGFGRVEAYNSSTSEWNVFCDDGLFDDGDAVVLCQNLGFRGGRAICCSAVAYENSRSTLYEVKLYATSAEWYSFVISMFTN